MDSAQAVNELTALEREEMLSFGERQERADDILLDLLEALGHEAVVRAYGRALAL